ncbi:MAG: alpha/beta hydrolase domain-containing protein [Bryobacteraceae bacterium]|nr:alpha/beta hydrolase domain-containing protein [Bryobacteraceae bacterium]
MTRAFHLLLLAALALGPAWARLVRIEILERSPVLGGRAFAAGAYERIVARAHFALDPKHARNRRLVDLDLAPRNPQGQVEFSADLYLLQPADPARSNGTLLVEIPNRGGKAMLARFCYARNSQDPQTPEEFGDAWLLDQGYTLAWIGWQWDVPADNPKLLRLHAPAIPGVKGVVRAEFLPSERTARMPLSDRGHIAYPALDEPAVLTVRDGVLGRRRTIPALRWKFTADRTAVEMEAGFEPGRLYELVYRASDPRLSSAGLAAVRDAVSWLKHLPDAGAFPKPAPRVVRALGFGISQSGRFLRSFLYEAMNEDEDGRLVFDGVWADVAGAGRVFLNHRFAQPSRDGWAYWNTLYPTDLFPFTDTPQVGPSGRGEDGLLSRLRPERIPKLILTNGSWEYWNRCAALVHTDVRGRLDAPLHPNTRLYVLAGSQHGPGRLPQQDPAVQFPANPNDTRPFFRAVLSALEDWVRDGREPPPSQYPLLAEGQLVPRERIRWPKGARARLPQFPRQAFDLFFGDGFVTKGIVSVEPPRILQAYPVLLPQVDEDGIDLGGIRLPVVAVPLGAFTGWNLRHPKTGAPEQIGTTAGSFFAFDESEILRRYRNREEYLRRVDAAARELVRRRFLLEMDRAHILRHAGELWDFVMKR